MQQLSKLSKPGLGFKSLPKVPILDKDGTLSRNTIVCIANEIASLHVSSWIKYKEFNFEI